LIRGESLHLPDGGELLIDLRDPSANRRLGEIADHTVEPVIADIASVSRRKVEKTFDDSTLGRLPGPHGAG
jgi:hypothetical protein